VSSDVRGVLFLLSAFQVVWVLEQGSDDVDEVAHALDRCQGAGRCCSGPQGFGDRLCLNAV
jgi:hypothetical protein